MMMRSALSVSTEVSMLWRSLSIILWSFRLRNGLARVMVFLGLGVGWGGGLADDFFQAIGQIRLFVVVELAYSDGEWGDEVLRTDDFE